MESFYENIVSAIGAAIGLITKFFNSFIIFKCVKNIRYSAKTLNY